MTDFYGMKWDQSNIFSHFRTNIMDALIKRVICHCSGLEYHAQYPKQYLLIRNPFISHRISFSPGPALS